MATATEKAHSTTDNVAHAAHDTIDRTAETAGRVEERLRKNKERARARAQDMENEAVSYISEHPFIAVGAAAAAGMILGALLRR